MGTASKAEKTPRHRLTSPSVCRRTVPEERLINTTNVYILVTLMHMIVSKPMHRWINAVLWWRPLMILQGCNLAQLLLWYSGIPIKHNGTDIGILTEKVTAREIFGSWSWRPFQTFICSFGSWCLKTYAQKQPTCFKLHLKCFFLGGSNFSQKIQFY